ncbi:unnamed protein product, partial [Ostreobium quekettii]
MAVPSPLPASPHPAVSPPDTAPPSSAPDPKAQQLHPRKLLEAVQEAHASFNPGRLTLDSHADECVAALRLPSAQDETFLRQVLYGLVRYRRLLNAFVNSFYHNKSGEVLRGDVCIYKIYAYLAIFRLEEITFPEFRRLVAATDPHKMAVFLTYLFDEGNLKEFCRHDWLKIYDKPFVDGTINNLLKWLPQVTKLVEELSSIVYAPKK